MVGENKISDLPIVILAAGKGSRLGNLTEDCSKTLLKVNGKSLLDRQIDVVKSFGFTKIVLVTGFKNELFDDVVKREGLSKIINPNWDTMNNVFSAYCAQWCGLLDDGFYLLNSDMLLSKDIFAQIVECEHGNAMLIDNVKVLTDEAMKVKCNDDGVITEISKSIESGAVGEYIGCVKFDALGAAKFFEKLDEMLENGRENEWYDIGIGEIGEVISLRCCYTKGYPWVEVDDESDLRRAEEIAREIDGE